jgi:hypothetical protein
MTDITTRFYAFMGTVGPSHVSVTTDPTFVEFQTIGSEIFHRLDEPGGAVYDVQSEIESLEESLHSLQVDDQSRAHCESIVDILYLKLKAKLSEVQDRDMIELRRQMNMTEYFKPKGMAGVVRWTSEVKGAGAATSSTNIPPVTDLDREGEVLLATYQSDLDEIVTVRSRIAETSALMSLLSTKAIEQVEIADSILSLANDSVDFIDKADVQLKKAIEHDSSYRFYVVMWFMILSFLLLIFDFIK